MAALIAAGGAIVGDLISSAGQHDTNAQSAAEAAKNRDFQAQQQMQVEGWETDMSNTAMQRRVTDLTAAGINPLLAVSQGGASQPSVSPASGSMPAFGNPGAAFGNLGMQTAAAQTTDSTIKLQQAQADSASAQAKYWTNKTPKSATTGTGDDGIDEVGDDYHKLGDADVAQTQAQTGLIASQAKQVNANVGLINAQVNNTDQQTALANVTTILQGLNRDVLMGTKQALIQQEVAKGNQASVLTGKYGQIISAINAALQPISNAAGAAAKTRGAVQGLGTGSKGPTFNMELNQ